jgi:hypothetical protein
MPVPFSVSAYVDGRLVSEPTEAANVALAKAVEWHVVRKFADVSISVIRLMVLHRQWRF